MFFSSFTPPLDCLKYLLRRGERKKMNSSPSFRRSDSKNRYFPKGKEQLGEITYQSILISFLWPAAVQNLCHVSRL